MTVGDLTTALLAALPIREKPETPPETTLGVADVILVGGIIAGLLVISTVLITRRLIARQSKTLLDENHARAAMEKLCPHGWTAQLTVYGGRAPLPDDAPTRIPGLRVRLDWAELAEGEHEIPEVAVARRLWSQTVAGALRGMVDDRRLDAQLEEIERAGVGNDPGGEGDRGGGAPAAP